MSEREIDDLCEALKEKLLQHSAANYTIRVDSRPIFQDGVGRYFVKEMDLLEPIGYEYIIKMWRK